MERQSVCFYFSVQNKNKERLSYIFIVSEVVFELLTYVEVSFKT